MAPNLIIWIHRFFFLCSLVWVSLLEDQTILLHPRLLQTYPLILRFVEAARLLVLLLASSTDVEDLLLVLDLLLLVRSKINSVGLPSGSIRSDVLLPVQVLWVPRSMPRSSL